MQNFTKTRVIPLYERVGFDLSAENSHSETKYQSLVVSYACSYGVGDCSTSSLQLFNTLMESNGTVEWVIIQINSKQYTYSTVHARILNVSFIYSLIVNIYFYSMT